MTRPPKKNPPAAIYRSFRAFVERHGLVGAGDGVLAAVSGGSDSTAMLHLLALLRRDVPFDLTVATVDHGLRRETAGEARHVEGVARRLGARFLLLSGDARARARREKKSLQHAARDLRYELLAAAAREAGASRVAVGHTLDDQAETLLMNLVRGCGLGGLGGMRPLRPPGLIRPVLALRRGELMEFLGSIGEEFRSDPGNEDRRFMRVRVRKEILPLLEKENPGIVVRLGELASEVGESLTFLEGAAGGFLARAAEKSAGGGWSFPRKLFLAEHAGLRPRIVRRVLLDLAGTLLGFYRPHFDAVERLARGREGSKSVRLPLGAVARREYDTLIFEKRRAQVATERGGDGVIVDGPGVFEPPSLGVRAIVGGEAGDGAFPLELRGRRRGDRLAGRRKSLKEFLIDLKVPRGARDFVPLLVREGSVVQAGELFRAEGFSVTCRFEQAGESSPYFHWLKARRKGVK